MVPVSAVVLTAFSGNCVAFCTVMSQGTGTMVAQLLPEGQQRTVVLPARGMQVVPVPQQKLSGSPSCGHCEKLAAEQTDCDCREKRVGGVMREEAWVRESAVRKRWKDGWSRRMVKLCW